IGTGVLFGDCLARFERLECRKVLVPGNHDIWVTSEDENDSLTLYRKELPRIATLHNFHYLDAGPLLLPEADVALAGTINWYDSSWSREQTRYRYPNELYRLLSNPFTRGRHNDANFVRWPLADLTFTAEVVATFEHQLQDALAAVSRAIVVTHHPPFYGLSF